MTARFHSPEAEMGARRVPLLSPDTVLVHTAWCTVREQEDQHLFYNSKTDEMHLIPPEGVYVYELCDGLANLGQIEDALLPSVNGDRPILRARLLPFLAGLVERGILRINSETTTTPPEVCHENTY